MQRYHFEDFAITLDQQGSKRYTKTSYPVRYGSYSEIDFSGCRFQFNRNGEIKFITGSGPDWPHPAEWLKRTIGNDWIYYSTGRYYAGVVDLFGEYYQPSPAYRTNTLFRDELFARPGVSAALKTFEEIGPYVSQLGRKEFAGADPDLQDFLRQVARYSSDRLQSRSAWLHRILKARIPVLPPDCRHVDYDVIPLMITDGCLYNCSFCEVKTGLNLSCRSRQDIEEQLLGLQEFFGADLENYNSIYLGQHDALGARPDDIFFAAERAYELFAIRHSFMQGANLFLFGSADSFLEKDAQFWQALDRLPFKTYVNLGLESFDSETLGFLKKPVSSAVMLKAFRRLLEINKSCANVEVTANIILGEHLPEQHIPVLLKQVGKIAKGFTGKGCLYISPLKGSKNTQKLLNQFRTIKQKSRLPAFLYLIQRL